jgi:hypothetical protein
MHFVLDLFPELVQREISLDTPNIHQLHHNQSLPLKENTSNLRQRSNHPNHHPLKTDESDVEREKEQAKTLSILNRISFIWKGIRYLILITLFLFFLLILIKIANKLQQ